MTVNELYEIYLKSIQLEKKRTTIDSIEYRFKNRIKDRFGNMNIEDITEEMIQEYQKEMVYIENLSPDYINKIIGIMRQMFDYAVRKGILSYNELAFVKKVKNQYRIEKRQVVWGINEFKVFESYIADDMDKLLFNMLFYLGLRKGELLALKWSSINFEKKTVNIISTAVQIVGKGQVITTPKTKKSIREIYMNDSLFNMLRDYYFKIKLKYEVVNHLFVLGDRKMVSFSALDRKLAKYLKLSQLEKINLHGFRHSHATMLAGLTSDIKSISERLGHESVDVTLNEYVHSNDYSQRELANLIENVVVENDCSFQFDGFIEILESMLLREITKERYKENEIKSMINIYNFIKNREFK